MKKYLTRLLAALLAAALLTAPASALTVEQALDLLEENFYYDIPEEAYQVSSLDELIQVLGDPYTAYMTAEEYSTFLDSVEDTVDLVGIGVVIQYTEQGFFVERTLTGGSAQAAGLRSGDLITAIDGISCVPAEPNHRDLMLGQEGSRVTITVLRDGKEMEFTLIRTAVHVPNTEITLLNGGVGYVDCNSFGTDTGELFSTGLKQYDDQVSYWLVDLRDNVGGYVGPAADMLAALCGPGYCAYFEYRDSYVVALPSTAPAVTDKPLILLVNRSSASASELLSAGVRDTGRGISIGNRTYGKGIAQNVLDETSHPDLFDGDSLKLTTSRFYSAGATTTDRIGVIPTLLVDDVYAELVALALTGGDQYRSTLCIIPEAQPFYVDPDTDEDVLAALLEAIPPQMPVFCCATPGAAFNQCTPAEAAEMLGVSYNSRWFSDLSGSAYASAANSLSTYRLLAGTEPGVFSPKEQLTRAQLCVMLSRLLNVTYYMGGSMFSDVPENAWYAGAVNAMAVLGLVNGVGGGKFQPNGVLTQQEFLTIMGRTARYLNLNLDRYGASVEASIGNLPLDMQYDLAPYANWAKPGAAVLAWGLADSLGGQGSLLYTSLNYITPSAPVLREEAAAGMYALLAGLEILP